MSAFSIRGVGGSGGGVGSFLLVLFLCLDLGGEAVEAAALLVVIAFFCAKVHDGALGKYYYYTFQTDDQILQAIFIIPEAGLAAQN